jgi:hypothetical protein
MNWQLLKDQADASELIGRFAWSCGFVREMYLVSPSYVMADSGATVNADALPSLKTLIATADETTPGVELLFVRLISLEIWFGGDLAPSVTIKPNRVEWRFHQSGPSPRTVVSELLYYRWLDRSCWGKELHYGWQQFYTDNGTVQLVDL